MDEYGSSRHTASGEQNVVCLEGNAVTLLVETSAELLLAHGSENPH